jgi:DNA-binding SARP family transcriptional activator/LysM repeat protein
MNQPPRRRPRSTEVVRGLSALALLVILTAGVPAALFAVAGSPLPHAMPSWPQITATLTRPDTDNTLFLTLVKITGWTAWSLFALITLTETIAYRRGRPSRRLPGLISPMQRVARDLIAMTALIVSATAPALSSANPTFAEATHPPTAAASAAVSSPHGRPPAVSRSNEPRGQWRSRVVKHGDTLWAIARTATGSGSRYLAIFNASKHLTQPRGLPHLTNPDRIYPGQHIKIPPRLTVRAPSPPSADTPHPPNVHRSTTPSAPHRSPAPRPTPTDPTPSPAITRPTDEPPTPASPPWTAPTPPQTRPPASTPPPLTRARPAPSTPTPSADTRPPPTPQTAPGHHHPPVTVTLPTGAYLGLGLVTAISIALTATRLHRRRRRDPAPAWPGQTQPGTPTAVAKARRAHLDAHAERGEAPPTDAELLARDIAESAPTHITAGTRDGQEVRVALSGLKLGVTGPGTAGAVRALATELLARSHRDRVEVLIPEPDAVTLFAGTGIAPGELAHDIPGLNLPASLQAAITHLEAELVHRARLMEDSGQPDIDALRRSEPGEPLPTLILIAATPPSSDALEALLSLSAPYGLGAVLLGDSSIGTTITVTSDGNVTEAHGPQSADWAGSRLFHLDPGETAELLQTVRTAHGRPEPAPASVRTTARTPSSRDTSAPTALAPAQVAAVRPAAPEGQETPRPVQLRVLGAVRLEAHGKPISTGLRRITRDLLAYLALHPHGITREHGVDALMPDRDLSSGITMLHTAINNARKTLRPATGLREAMFVIHADGRYQLDPRLIDVDLWRLQTVLNRAHHAETDSSRIDQLRRVLDLYTAELAEDLTYEWAETERENLRRHATDALSQLAQLTHETHPDHAITALQAALAHDPYAEPLYRDLMRIQAATGRPDAVRRTYDQLKRHLADLDTEPDEQTHQLLLTLLRPASTGGPRRNDPPSPAQTTTQRRPPPQMTGTGTGSVRPLRPRNPD